LAVRVQDCRDQALTAEHDIAKLAADYEAGPSQLCGTPGAHQQGHIAASLEKPPAKIPADRAGANYENPHLQSLCKEVRLRWLSQWASRILPSQPL
jgi:hypothetical protein